MGMATTFIIERATEKGGDFFTRGCFSTMQTGRVERQLGSVVNVREGCVRAVHRHKWTVVQVWKNKKKTFHNIGSIKLWNKFYFFAYFYLAINSTETSEHQNSVSFFLKISPLHTTTGSLCQTRTYKPTRTAWNMKSLQSSSPATRTNGWDAPWLRQKMVWRGLILVSHSVHDIQVFIFACLRDLDFSNNRPLAWSRHMVQRHTCSFLNKQTNKLRL